MSIGRNSKRQDSNSKVDELYLELAWRILSIVYEPGEVLNETTLAAEFNVSRTPVREALRRLQQDGWLIMLPNIGMQVSPLYFGELRGIYSTKEVLEKLALEQAMQYVTDDDINDLKNILATLQATDDEEIDTITNLDSEFLFRICKISKNDILYAHIYDLQEKVYRLWRYVLKHGANINKDQLLEVLSGLVECIEKKDKSGIDTAVSNYIAFHKEEIKDGMF